MKVVKNYYVIYNKVTKQFGSGNTDDCLVDELDMAFKYSTKEYAKEELSEFDCPEEYEIWELEVIYQTV